MKKKSATKKPKGMGPAMPVDAAPKFGGKKKGNMADTMLNKLCK